MLLVDQHGARLLRSGRDSSHETHSTISGGTVAKLQRIRDPLHDLIIFGENDFDGLMWEALNSREFQRLRRIKQLGFSELVYPGATHTRLAHSAGVFHVARQLASLIKTRIGNFDPDRAQIAMAAALVHDVGHGPFSHAFEDAMKQLGKGKERKPKRHELWTADIVTGDTELGSVLSKAGTGFRDSVAALLKNESPTDIYSAIVSSQFDADRLDYVRRDRLMTGAQHGGFDYPWLLANLEVDKIPLAIDGEHYAEAETLILGGKAFQAAESYVLGLFHMYFAVYFHKATRSAEKLLTALVCRVGELLEKGEVDKSGLPANHPLVRFLQNQELSEYLALDDFVIWSSLHFMAEASDQACRDLSFRLLNRRLYKAIEIGELFAGRDDAVPRFKMRLRDASANQVFKPNDVFEDQTNRTPYKLRGYDTSEAMAKIHIRKPDGNYEDLAKRSEVVKALQSKSIYRVYVRDDAIGEQVRKLAEGL
ncbi:HD domain-containing protein [Bradyrhizobium yuanmingense]|uniref:HD domain-containing protein n=1 Tax=Bradyrhizobium yuanmingense TaxID=108015 RepID=UPI0035154088